MKKILHTVLPALICLSALPLTRTSAKAPSRFTATFIQNWYCRDWTQERWEQEFAEAKSAGFDSLILQSTFDIVRGECCGDKHDPAAYTDTQSFCMFPSEYSTDHHSSQNSGDALELALKAAKAEGMQLWLGTVNDDMWWNYGWGAPDSYFAEWCDENAILCSGLITEMWQRYGGSYGEQIAGWYYTNELWNIDAACSGSDGGAYADIIGTNIAEDISSIESSCPEKPLMISPFFNTDLSSAEEFGGFVSDVIDSAGFRSIDIYAPQNGGGREYSAEIIRQWALAQKNAAEGRMRFWINCESFGTDNSTKPVAALREDYLAAADLAEEHILFSWDHYYASDSALNSEFAAFALESTEGDVNGDNEFSIADLVVLQKWLLAVPGTELANWHAADLCVDGRLNVFDLCAMRDRLIQS